MVVRGSMGGWTLGFLRAGSEVATSCYEIIILLMFILYEHGFLFLPD